MKGLDFSRIRERRSQRSANKIGRNLFLLYTSLNDIVVCGRKIVHGFHLVVRSLERHIANGDVDYVSRDSSLAGLILVQSGNIRRMVASITSLGPVLQVIHPKAYIDLIPLLEEKGEDILGLSSLLASFKVPLAAPDAERVTEMIEMHRASLVDWDSIPVDDYRKYQANDIFLHRSIFNHGLLRELYTALEAQAIYVPGAIDRSQIEPLKAFLETGTAEYRLDEIAGIADGLRTEILRHFDIRDILLEVGDVRSPLSISTHNIDNVKG